MIQHESPLPSVYICNKYLCNNTPVVISGREVLSNRFIHFSLSFFVKLHNHIDIVTDYMSVACYDTSSCQLKTKERRDQFIYNNVNISGNMIQSWIHVQVLYFFSFSSSTSWKIYHLLCMLFKNAFDNKQYSSISTSHVNKKNIQCHILKIHSCIFLKR